MIESFHRAAESKDANSGSSARTSESKKDKKDSVDKKKIGTFTAKNVVEAPNIHRPKAEKPTLWQELAGVKDKKPEEASPFKAPIKEDRREKDEKDEKDKKSPDEVREEAEKHEADEPEKLDVIEQHEVVRRITEAVGNDARSTPDNETESSEEENEDETMLAQDAASIALTESVQRKLAEKPDAPVEEILDEATAETVERIETSEADVAEDAEEAEKAEERVEESAESTEPGAPTEGEIPLHTEAIEDEDATTIVIPRSGGSGGTTPPPVSGGGGGNSGSGGSGGSSGGSGGGMPPYGPGSAGMPPSGGGSFGPVPGVQNFNAAPVTPAATGVSIEDLNRVVHRQERIAMAHGLLVGGIIGYLIGRRRGRIKTEKRLLPIQNKLEKQVVGLQTAVLEKDQKVRQLAAEKAREMASQEQRDRFAEKLARDEAIRAKTAERREAVTARKEGPKPFELGRMVVEAPAVILAAVSAAGRTELGVEAPKATALPVKKVENYTSGELKQAAEKIRIDGTSVKEMWDRGQISERSVERIVTEFIEGHSIRAALNKELFEEGARYEIDPKLRGRTQSGMRGGNAGGSGGHGDKTPVLQAGAAMLLRTVGGNADKNESDSNVQKMDTAKQPSVLKKMREQPTPQLAAAGAVIGILLLIAAFLIF